MFFLDFRGEHSYSKRNFIPVTVEKEMDFQRDIVLPSQKKRVILALYDREWDQETERQQRWSDIIGVLRDYVTEHPEEAVLITLELKQDAPLIAQLPLCEAPNILIMRQGHFEDGFVGFLAKNQIVDFLGRLRKTSSL